MPEPQESTRKAKPSAADQRAAERLRATWNARKGDLGLTQSNFSERAGVEWTQGAVSQYLNGVIPLNYMALVAFSKALEIAPEDIRNDLPEQATKRAVKDQDWSDVRGYRTAAALGDGAVPDEYAETHKLRFRADSLQRKRLRAEKLGVCYGRGDSMLPRIKSGDAIMFDMSDTDPKDGHLFVVTYDGHLMAKQLSEIGGRWFIESLNRDDPKWRKPIPIDEFKGFQIHGRVRWIGSWED